MIAMLSSDSDSIGVWAESCPCHPLAAIDQTADAETKRQAKLAAQSCAFKCCRAPELACGHAIKLVLQKVNAHKVVFSEYASRAPETHRTELHSSWEAACSKLFGCLTDFGLVVSPVS